MKKSLFVLIGVLYASAVIGCAGGAKKDATNNADKKIENAQNTKQTNKMSGNSNEAGQAGETIWSKTCKVSGDTRMIAVNKVGNGCAVKYTKLESTSTPATSQRGTQYCEGVANRIFDNLKNAGFECQ